MHPGDAAFEAFPGHEGRRAGGHSTLASRTTAPAGDKLGTLESAGGFWSYQVRGSLPPPLTHQALQPQSAARLPLRPSTLPQHQHASGSCRWFCSFPVWTAWLCLPPSRLTPNAPSSVATWWALLCALTGQGRETKIDQSFLSSSNNLLHPSRVDSPFQTSPGSAPPSPPSRGPRVFRPNF